MNLFELTPECLDAAQGRLPGGDKRRDRPVGIRVLKNGFAERFLGTSRWFMPIVWFGPVIAYGLWRSLRDGHGPLATLALFAGGWLVWTLMEYVLHRFVFHMHAETPEQKLRAFLMHGYHHDFPDDPIRLVAPPLFSWMPAIVVGTIYRLAFGAELWAPLLAGTAAGYVAYDLIHYYTHHARPRGGIGRWLRRYHMQHHHDVGDRQFGVSSPLWDLVFRTFR